MIVIKMVTVFELNTTRSSKCVKWMCFLVFYCFVTVEYVTGDIQLHGSGATFPSEVYEAWLPVYQFERSEFLHVRLKYLLYF